MKRIIGIFLSAMLFLAACGPKPYYKTGKGKKKQKYYNKVQYGIEDPGANPVYKNKKKKKN
jgi:hypothetical protein